MTTRKLARLAALALSTLAVAAASSPTTFSDLQANFERLIESWSFP